MTMNSVLLRFISMPAGAPRWPRKSVVATALALLMSGFAYGQEQQFAFDARGNLLTQTAENIASPEILSQPQPQVVVPGALASFFVVAANTSQLAYQWRFNGATIAGATSDALLLQNVSTANEGQYSVVLVNSSGSVISAPAALMLDADRDGLPDSWEQTYFGGSGQRPTGDFDGDGVSNLDEFLDGTNPADSASVLFRLTLVSDGGQVVVSPSRFTFTNGEVVTLTATAIAPNTFHGWRGATNSTENPISLIMDGNKTVYAYLGTYDISWTNNTSGDWNVASNWSPDFVPGTNDNVFIASSDTVTLNGNAFCGSLTLSAGTLTGSGALTLQRDSWWTGGTMSGSGRTIIPVGVTLNLANAGGVSLNTRTLENGGTVLWTGAGSLTVNGAVITNRAGALFENRAAGGLSYGGVTGRFDNAGTFRKTVNPGTTTVFSGVVFNNYNTVEIQTGTLALAGGGANSGTFDVPAGTTLNLGGAHSSTGGSSITGAGNFTVSSGTANLAGLVNVSGTHLFDAGTANLTGNYLCTNNTLLIAGGTANFSGTGTVTPATLNLSSGTLSGNQVVTVLGVMNWTSGTMSGSGRTIIPVGVTLNLANAGGVSLNTRTLENGGTMLWTGAGSLTVNGAVITNRAGALFENRAAGPLSYGGVASRFDNVGLFRKSVSTGTMTVFGGIAFNNYNTVEIQTGILAANGGYTSTTNALLQCAIGGSTVGSGYGRLQLSGAVTLNGGLGVVLSNGFLPATNDTFTVLTAGTRNGAFANFYYPSNEVTMQMSNTANSVIVRVTDVLVVARPILLRPELLGQEITFTWTASSNLTYRLEYNPDFGPSNWIVLPGDVIGVSNTASKMDTLTSSNRFYRVRIVP